MSVDAHWPYIITVTRKKYIYIYFSLLLAAGFGYGLMHSIMLCGSILASSEGPGVLYENSCQNIPLVFNLGMYVFVRCVHTYDLDGCEKTYIYMHPSIYTFHYECVICMYVF